jgi:mannose-6-phosphate isomerase-like protein (cupin superfamily)
VETHTPAISVTWVRIWGRHERVVNSSCDRVYYIISGSGRFQVGDAPAGSAEAGDFVFIPRDTSYEFEGSMTYIVMNGPAFTPGSDRVLPSTLA